MQNYIRKRAVKVAQHIMLTSNTVRQTAEVFGISKSTVHKDVAERLPRINREMAEQVKTILEKIKPSGTFAVVKRLAKNTRPTVK
jgi:Stage III sporulation protein D.